jgi:hypothetical protein
MGRLYLETTGSEAPKKSASTHFVSFLNRVGGIFLAPDDTFNQMLSQRVRFWQPLVIVIALFAIQGAVIASFAFRLFQAIADFVSPLTGTIGAIGFASVVFAAMIFGMIVCALIFWVIVAAIAHLIARYVFRGKGSYVQLLKFYGFALVPYSLIILSTVLFASSWGLWPLSVFLHTVAYFWIVFLMATAVKHNYSIDAGKGFISSFIGPMLVVLIIVGIFWTWVWLAISAASGGFM